MIVLLISTVWLATLALVVTVCRMAAFGDRGALAPTERSPRLLDLRGNPEHNGPWKHEQQGSSPSSHSPGNPRRQPLSLRVEDRRAKSSPTRSQPSTAEHVGNGAQQDLYVRP